MGLTWHSEPRGVDLKTIQSREGLTGRSEPRGVDLKTV